MQNAVNKTAVLSFLVLLMTDAATLEELSLKHAPLPAYQSTRDLLPTELEKASARSKTENQIFGKMLDEYAWIDARRIETLTEAEKNFLICVAAIRAMCGFNRLTIDVATDIVVKNVPLLTELPKATLPERISDSILHLRFIEADKYCDYDRWQN